MSNLITELKNYPKTWREFEKYYSQREDINSRTLTKIFYSNEPQVGLREALEDFLDAKGVHVHSVEKTYYTENQFGYCVQVFKDYFKEIYSISANTRSEAFHAAVIEAFKYLEGKGNV